MDGASKWTQFRRITLPLLRPALLPSVILGCVWTFNMFNVIYLVSGGEPGGATDILVSRGVPLGVPAQRAVRLRRGVLGADLLRALGLDAAITRRWRGGDGMSAARRRS